MVACPGFAVRRLPHPIIRTVRQNIILVLTWAFPADEGREKKHSRVTFEIEPVKDVVRLTVTHDRLEPGSEMDESLPGLIGSAPDRRMTRRGFRNAFGTPFSPEKDGCLHGVCSPYGYPHDNPIGAFGRFLHYDQG